MTPPHPPPCMELTGAALGTVQAPVPELPAISGESLEGQVATRSQGSDRKYSGTGHRT